jgi:hypothetical protein
MDEIERGTEDGSVLLRMSDISDNVLITSLYVCDRQN